MARAGRADFGHHPGHIDLAGKRSARRQKGSSSASPSGNRCKVPVQSESAPSAETIQGAKGKPRSGGFSHRQGRQDSNLQPPVLETGALPVELRPSAVRTPIVVGPPFAGDPRHAGVETAIRRRSRTLPSAATQRTNLIGVRVPSQRPALGALFLVLCLLFAGIAAAAFEARAWVIAFAAGVLGLWLLTLAGRALLVRRLRGQ
jgi:hypothetical protein